MSLIEAVHRTSFALTPRRAKPIGRGRVAPATDPAQPETWRVCFQLHIKKTARNARVQFELSANYPE
jgi:hypothetical protein